jgi:hypothetical protein
MVHFDLSDRHRIQRFAASRTTCSGRRCSKNGDFPPQDVKTSARNVTQSLLSSVFETINEKQQNPPTASSSTMQPLVQNMLQSTLRRAYSTTSQASAATTTTRLNDTLPELPHYEFPFATRYRNHPAINNVALAHALWASVLRPNVDTAIDATCGNGYDSVKLAQLLFPPCPTEKECHSQLICLDVQPQACDNTRQALRHYFQKTHGDGANQLYQSQVHVLHASHEILPRPTHPVGLVVYNLGWLPNFEKECTTHMATTLASLAEAALSVREGGMISVITYPATGPEEDRAVRLLMECLALRSSKTRTWQGAISSLVNDDSSSGSIATHVKQAMGRIVSQGPPDQTWRVTQHDKLGMDQAPILITATRIK